jgi:hypothetical protein
MMKNTLCWHQSHFETQSLNGDTNWLLIQQLPQPNYCFCLLPLSTHLHPLPIRRCIVASVQIEAIALLFDCESHHNGTASQLPRDDSTDRSDDPIFSADF